MALDFTTTQTWRQALSDAAAAESDDQAAALMTRAVVLAFSQARQHITRARLKKIMGAARKAGIGLMDVF